MSDHALTIDGITVRYGGVTAVSGVSFAVAPGETCGLIGPNGAGKTTLLDCVSGLRRPSSGRIVLEREDVTRRSAVARARAGMRRTFQRHQVFGRLTVLDNLLTAVEWRGGGGGVAADLLGLPARRRLERERRARAEQVMRLCGLERLRDVHAGTLPVGAARMLELARAVIDRPAVLLLDEPTSGLDQAETERLARVLADLRDAHGCAVLLVAHDVGFVMDVCDRVVVLNLGEVIADAPPGRVRADTRVREAYLR